MTPLNVTFSYMGEVGAGQMRRLAEALSVYGLRGLQLDEKAKTITIEFDAARLDNDLVLAVVKNCGISATGQVETSVVA
ncbi:MAG TPA: hypothetical protein VE996_00280 [Terriglobales bacterium]|nr:hypothetical protein [Terriglobales bacterium]